MPHEKKPRKPRPPRAPKDPSLRNKMYKYRLSPTRPRVAQRGCYKKAILHE